MITAGPPRTPSHELVVAYDGFNFATVDGLSPLAPTRCLAHRPRSDVRFSERRWVGAFEQLVEVSLDSLTHYAVKAKKVSAIDRFVMLFPSWMLYQMHNYAMVVSDPESLPFLRA
eukprot:2156495-Pyramimonas_sp.AAC.1